MQLIYYICYINKYLLNIYISIEFLNSIILDSYFLLVSYLFHCFSFHVSNGCFLYSWFGFVFLRKTDTSERPRLLLLALLFSRCLYFCWNRFIDRTFSRFINSSVYFSVNFRSRGFSFFFF